jgi:hypothetical protein
MKIGDQSKVDASVTTEKSSFNPSEYDQKGRKVIEGKLLIADFHFIGGCEENFSDRKRSYRTTQGKDLHLCHN